MYIVLSLLRNQQIDRPVTGRCNRSSKGQTNERKKISQLHRSQKTTSIEPTLITPRNYPHTYIFFPPNRPIKIAYKNLQTSWCPQANWKNLKTYAKTQP